MTPLLYVALDQLCQLGHWPPGIEGQPILGEQPYDSAVTRRGPPALAGDPAGMTGDGEGGGGDGDGVGGHCARSQASVMGWQRHGDGSGSGDSPYVASDVLTRRIGRYNVTFERSAHSESMVEDNSLFKLEGAPSADLTRLVFGDVQ